MYSVPQWSSHVECSTNLGHLALKGTSHYFDLEIQKNNPVIPNTVAVNTYIYTTDTF